MVTSACTIFIAATGDSAERIGLLNAMDCTHDIMD
jgi:hypothetical protein